MKTLGILLGLLLLVASPVAEAAPDSISFAGRLSTQQGPFSGTQSITFKMFGVATGGTSVWTDTLSLTADNGLVYATLGSSANPLDQTVFAGTPVYLEITVGSETLTPRLPIDAVPYAVSATTADKLGGVITATDVVQSVVAGAGLSGGGTASDTGSVTLSVNTSTIQSRVTGSCTTGNSIRAVASDGTVTCQADTNSGGDDHGCHRGQWLVGRRHNRRGQPVGRYERRAVAGLRNVRRRLVDSNDQQQTVPSLPDGADNGGTITGVTAGTGLSGGGDRRCVAGGEHQCDPGACG